MYNSSDNHQFPQWFANYLPATNEETDSKLTQSKKLAIAMAVYLVFMLLLLAVVVIVKHSITGSVF